MGNLIDRSAPDKPGLIDVTAVRLRTEDLEWLRTLPNGVSYHVRQAVKLYRDNNRYDAGGENDE